MSVFDEAKDKAQQYMGQAKDKLGQQQDGQGQDGEQNEGMSGDLRDKGFEAVENAKDRFGN